MPLPYVPAPLELDDVLRIVYFIELDQQQMLMVLHGRVRGSGVGDYIADIQLTAEHLAAEVFGTGIFSGYRIIQSEEVFWQEVRVQRISPVRDVYMSSLIALSGGEPQPASPPNVALTVNKRTARPGRHGHGDLHTFGFDVAKMDEGLWDTTLVAAVNSVFELDLTAQVNVPGGPDFNWCLFDPSVGSGGPQDIIGTVPAFAIKTMHRRTVGLGI